MSRLVNHLLIARGCDDIIPDTVWSSVRGSRAHVTSVRDHGLQGPAAVMRAF